MAAAQALASFRESGRLSDVTTQPTYGPPPNPNPVIRPGVPAPQRDYVAEPVELATPSVAAATPRVSASSPYVDTVQPETPKPVEQPRTVRPTVDAAWRRNYAVPAAPTQGAGIGIRAGTPLTAITDAAQSGNQWLDETKPQWGIGNQIFQQRREQYGKAMQSFGLGQQAQEGVIPGLIGRVAEVSSNLGAGNILPAFDWTYQQLGGIAIPGTDLTLGQAVGIGEDALGKMNEQMATAKAEAAKTQDLASPLGYLDAVGQNAQIMFDGFADYAQFYMDGVDATNAALTPTPEQLSRSTPDKIAEARALGKFIGYSGVDATAKAFDAMLDSPALGQEKVDQAAQLLDQAQQLPEGPERQAALVQAAQMGAEGVKLRDQTLLEVYDDSQVWYRELAAGFFLDPLNAIGLVGKAGKAIGLLPGGLTPMGRRAAEAARVGGMAENAKLGQPSNAVGNVVNIMAEALKTGTSKAKSDQYWLWNGVMNLVSNVSTKDDVLTVIGDLIANPTKLAEQGVEIARLTSPEAAAQLNLGGFMRFGWAGIKNAEFQRSSRVIRQPGFLDALATLPSMRPAAAGEVIDKTQFMADFHGLIGRWAGWEHGVSAMDGVPYAAKSARVVAGTTPGTFAVEFMDGKTVLSKTIDMAQADAQVGLRNAERAIKRGEEYRRNPMEMIADMQRNFFSSLALNANPSSIARNVLGGLGMGMINLEDSRMFQKLDSHLGYVMGKTGGLFPDLRIATGSGGLPGPTGLNIGSKGYWRGSDVVNKLLFGLPEKGRQLRNWSEEAMVSMVYGTGFRQGYERGAVSLGKDIERLVGEFITDPKQTKPIVDQLVSTIIHGNRQDLARVAAEIAGGKPAVSLRNLSPAFPELLDDAQVVEVDGLLRNLTTANAGQFLARIDEIFQEKMGETLTQIGEFATPKRFFWTVADRTRDRAEFDGALKAGLKTGRITQQQYDVLVPILKEADRLATQADEALLGVLQASYGRPDTIPAVYGAFLQSQRVTEDMRSMHSQLVKLLTEERATLTAQGIAGPDLARQMGESWSIFYEQYSDLARQAGQQRLQIFNGAFDAINNGNYKNLGAMAGNAIEDVLRLASVGDETSVRILQDMRMSFSGQDPQLFQKMVDGQRALTDQYTTQLLMAFQANPTTDAMDEFMSALSNVARSNGKTAAEVRRARKALDTWRAAHPNQPDPPALWDAVRAAHQKWVPTMRNNWEILQAGTARILEKKVVEDVLGGLRFNVAGSASEYSLIGPSSRKGFWLVLNEANGQTLHMGESQIPQQIIASLPGVKAKAQQLLKEQIGQLARQAGVQGIGVPEIDKIIDSLNKNPLGDVYGVLKQNVAEHILNNRSTSVIPGNMEDYILDNLAAAQHALRQVVPQIIQMNAQGYGKLGPQFVGRFNNDILPRLDNLVTQADRTGKAASSISMVDYINNYWPDVVLGMFAPYHFWFTRMAKNSLEQAVFNPRITANMSRLYNAVFAENQQQGVPNRNMFQIPGIGFETADAYNQFDLPFAQWIPIFPLMVQYGWADPNRINAAYEFVADNMTEGAFPGSQKRVLGNALLGVELAKRFGIGVYPWQDAALATLGGMRGETNLGSLGPIPRMLGNGAVLFGQWLRENGSPELAGALETVTKPMRPFYEPYLVGRQASFNANRGKLTDVQAQNVQDVGYQQFFPGTEPLLEQLPNAEQMYGEVRGQVSRDYLLRQFLGWLFPDRITANYKGEGDLNAAAQQRREMGWEPDRNLGGSREAQLAMYDLTPGLSARSSQYGVTAESAPQVPDPNAKRPGVAAAQAAYYDEKDAIYAKYQAQLEEVYRAHPELSQPGNSASPYTNPIYTARTAELKALDEKYPSAQTDVKAPPNADYKLVGTSPEEARNVAIVMIIQMAKAENAALDPGDYPTDGSADRKRAWNKQSDAYDAAVTATMQQLMNRPDIGALLTPGRVLPGAGRMPANPPLPLPAEQPSPGIVPPFGPRAPGGQLMPQQQISRVPATQGIDNPWAVDMAAAEQKYGLTPGLLSRIAQAESGFDPNAKSGAGAVGLMQFMPDTWSDAAKALRLTDINDPQQQIEAAGWYVDWLRKNLPAGKQGDDWVLAAYNLGIGKVSEMSSLSSLPAETSGYVAQITAAQGAPLTQSWQAPGAETQAFGNESDYYTAQGFLGHEGVDYGAPIGTPVSAAAGGTVVFAGEAQPANSAYGNYVVVNHGDGKQTWYAHLSGWDVKVGDTVRAGDLLGEVGNTGNSTGAHLHFAVRDTSQMDNGQKGFIDPQVWLAGMSVGAPTPVGVMLRPPTQGEAVPAPSPAGGIDWGGTATSLFEANENRFKGPEQMKSEAARNQAYGEMSALVGEKYPQVLDLYNNWQYMSAAERTAAKEKDPTISAANLLAYNPDAWNTIEQTFGEGSLLLYYRRPPYKENDPARSDYYRQYPQAFLVGAWLNGRPTIPTEQGSNEDIGPTGSSFEYDLGKDYEEARRKFGPDIWDIVKQAKQLPAYVKGNAESTAAWVGFHEQYPQYSPWSDWWYANLPDLPKAAQYQYGYGFGGGWGSGFSYKKESRVVTRPPSPYRRSYNLPEPTKYQAPSVGDGWRRYLNGARITVGGR